MMKLCKKCGKEKELTEFYYCLNKKCQKYFYRPECKICMNKLSRAWRKRNPERKKELVKRWRQEHPEMVAIYDKRKRAKNPEKYKQIHQNWVNNHRQQKVETMYKWRAKNPTKSIEYYHKAREKDIEAWRFKMRIKAEKRRSAIRYKDLTREELLMLLDRALQYGICPLCNEILNKKDVHLEHAIPVSRGGDWSKENVYYCCSRCNQRKANKTLEEYKGIKFEDLPITLLTTNIWQ